MRRRRGVSNPPPTASSSSASSSASFYSDAPQHTHIGNSMTLPVASTIRDRTPELLAIVQTNLSTTGTKTSTSLQQQQQQSTITAATPRSDFTRLAANVGKDIQQTSVKLTKLTKLAQRRSLFDDPTAEIQQLTFVIKQDIASLNGKLGDLQQLRDTTRRSSNKQAGDHSENVVNSLKGRLGATAQGFQKVLKMRTDSLAAQQDRRSNFMNTSGPGAPAFDAPAGSVALDLGHGSLGAAGGANGGGGGEQMQGMQLMRRGGETSYQDARADAVKQVESTIVELGQIFNQLATMVSEQGELVERIDANVEDTVVHMEAGQNQLMIYYNSIAGNRSLILKVFGVLLAFLILWTVIL